MMYIRYPLSLRRVEDPLFERGIDICHETVRFWWNRFGPMFAAHACIRQASDNPSQQETFGIDVRFQAGFIRFEHYVNPLPVSTKLPVCPTPPDHP